VKTLDASLRNFEEYAQTTDNARSRLREADQTANPEVADATGRAILRKNRRIHAFSICPAPSSPSTRRSFGKPGRLARLSADVPGDDARTRPIRLPQSASHVQMAMVSPYGEISYFVDF